MQVLLLTIYFSFFSHATYFTDSKPGITLHTSISHAIPLNSSEEICSDPDDDDFDFQRRLHQHYYLDLSNLRFSNIPVASPFLLNREKHQSVSLLYKICVLRL